MPHARTTTPFTELFGISKLAVWVASVAESKHEQRSQVLLVQLPVWLSVITEVFKGKSK